MGHAILLMKEESVTYFFKTTLLNEELNFIKSIFKKCFCVMNDTSGDEFSGGRSM
jgi:hypothetical protein